MDSVKRVKLMLPTRDMPTRDKMLKTCIRAHAYAQIKIQGGTESINMYDVPETIRQLIHYDREVMWRNAIITYKVCNVTSSCGEFIKQWHKHLLDNRMLDILWPDFEKTTDKVKLFPPFSSNHQRLLHHAGRRHDILHITSQVPFPAYTPEGKAATIQNFFDEVTTDEPYTQGTLIRWRKDSLRADQKFGVCYTSPTNPYKLYDMFQISLHDLQDLRSIQVPMYIHSQLHTHTWITKVRGAYFDTDILSEYEKTKKYIDKVKTLEKEQLDDPATTSLESIWWAPHLDQEASNFFGVGRVSSMKNLQDYIRCQTTLTLSNCKGKLDPHHLDVSPSVSGKGRIECDRESIYINTDGHKQFLAFRSDDKRNTLYKILRQKCKHCTTITGGAAKKRTNTQCTKSTINEDGDITYYKLQNPENASECLYVRHSDLPGYFISTPISNRTEKIQRWWSQLSQQKRIDMYRSLDPDQIMTATMTAAKEEVAKEDCPVVKAAKAAEAAEAAEVAVPDMGHLISELRGTLTTLSDKELYLTDICQQYRNQPNPFYMVYDAADAAGRDASLLRDSRHVSRYRKTIRWPMLQQDNITVRFEASSQHRSRNSIDNVVARDSSTHRDIFHSARHDIQVYLSRKLLQKAVLRSQAPGIASFGMWTTLAIGTCVSQFAVTVPPLLEFKFNFTNLINFLRDCTITNPLKFLFRKLAFLSGFFSWNLLVYLRRISIRVDAHKYVHWTWIREMKKFMATLRHQMKTRDALLVIDRTSDHLQGLSLQSVFGDDTYVSSYMCYYTVATLCQALAGYRDTVHLYTELYTKDIDSIATTFYSYPFNGKTNALGNRFRNSSAHGYAWTTCHRQLVDGDWSRCLPRPIQDLLVSSGSNTQVPLDLERMVWGAGQTKATDLNKDETYSSLNLGLNDPQALCPNLPNLPSAPSTQVDLAHQKLFGGRVHAMPLRPEEMRLRRELASLQRKETGPERTWYQYLRPMTTSTTVDPADREGGLQKGQYTIHLRDLITNGYHKINDNTTESFTAAIATQDTVEIRYLTNQLSAFQQQWKKHDEEEEGEEEGEEEDNSPEDIVIRVVEGKVTATSSLNNLTVSIDADKIEEYIKICKQRTLPPDMKNAKKGDHGWAPMHNVFFTVDGQQHRMGFDYFTVDKLFIKLLTIQVRTPVSVDQIFRTHNDTTLNIQRVEPHPQSAAIAKAMNKLLRGG